MTLAPALDQVLIRSLSVIVRGQLGTGEMATYFRVSGGGLGYTRSTLPSAYVHDALACFDPTSMFVETPILDALPPRARGRFVRTAQRIRRRIRQFLAWQEDCTGSWRFFGRGSGVAPDADSTAAAAASMLDGRRRAPGRPWSRHVRALAEIEASPAPTTGRAAEANALRLLALAGESVGGRIDELLRAAAEPLPPGAGHYATPLAHAYCAARAWAQARLSRREELAALLVPRVLALQDERGGFGGPLSTALGLSALVDLGHRGPELPRARAALLDLVGAWGGWPFEALFPAGGGSLACTTALAMDVLARTAQEAA
ncbi:MAG TPA: hypothetical protein VIG99_06230 [Myxococcaceae bacterium]|jgi:hypothetical protein